MQRTTEAGIVRELEKVESNQLPEICQSKIATDCEQHEPFRGNTLSPATSFLVPSAERYFTSEPAISPSAPPVQSEHQLDELFTQDVEKSELSEISEGPPAYQMLFPHRNPNSNRFTISHLST